MALCAAEVRRTGLVAGAPIVVLDADVAGTEVHWVWDRKEYAIAETALIDVVAARPDDRGPLQSLCAQVAALKADHGLVIPSFRSGAENDRGTILWKRVIERTGPYVRQRFEELLIALARAASRPAVVVDLPAFDVGFAQHAREVIEGLGPRTEKDTAGQVVGKVRLVTDYDRRSVREVWAHLRASGRKGRDMWRGVCLNEVRGAGAPKTLVDEDLVQRVRGVLLHEVVSLSGAQVAWRGADPLPILCPSRGALRRATGLEQSGSLSDQITATIIAMSHAENDDPTYAERLWTDP